MSLANQLNGISDQLQTVAPPPVRETILTANANFAASFDPSSTAQIGDTLPYFRLTNALGKEVSSEDLLSQGPLLITFYRGGWCPFCNLALRAFQTHLPAIQAKGVTLIAISPELPDSSLSTSEKNELKFPVLSDVGNKYAKELGIIFQQPDSLRPVFDNFGHDLKKTNGDDSFAVPVPATFLVDGKGIIRNSFVEPNYMKRLEPEEALKWIDEL